MASKGRGSGNDGLHEMASGLIHTGDSLAGGVRGTFVDRFGSPGEPTRKAKVSGDKGSLGRAPSGLFKPGKAR